MWSASESESYVQRTSGEKQSPKKISATGALISAVRSFPCKAAACATLHTIYATRLDVHFWPTLSIVQIFQGGEYASTQCVFTHTVGEMIAVPYLNSLLQPC